MQTTMYLYKNSSRLELENQQSWCPFIGVMPDQHDQLKNDIEVLIITLARREDLRIVICSTGALQFLLLH